MRMAVAFLMLAQLLCRAAAVPHAHVDADDPLGQESRPHIHLPDHAHSGHDHNGHDHSGQHQDDGQDYAPEPVGPGDHDQSAVYFCDLIVSDSDRDHGAQQTCVAWSLASFEVHLPAVTPILIERGTGPPLNRDDFIDTYLPHLLRI